MKVLLPILIVESKLSTMDIAYLLAYAYLYGKPFRYFHSL